MRLARTNAKMIRMDAIAYTTHRLGTNCFFLEPDRGSGKWLKEYVAPFDAVILPEVHEQYKYHLKISAKGYQTYDFALPHAGPAHPLSSQQ